MTEVVLLSNTVRLQQVQKNMTEVVLLPNTDRLQQVEKYDRACTTSTKF
jgi:hypothetical protein